MNRALKYLMLGSYLWIFGEGLLGPLYAVFAQRVGGDVLALSAAYALYLIIAGVLIAIVGKYSDSHGKASLLVAGYALNTVATFGYLLVDSTAGLFAVQALLGVALALANPTWFALVSERLDREHEGEEWGISDGGNKIAMGVALLLGGVVVELFGFRTLFLLMGSVQLAATVSQLSLLGADRR